jgi:hypothetical protein
LPLLRILAERIQQAATTITKQAFITAIKGLKMKKLLLIVMLALSTHALADKYVRGYSKSDGTYVQGHYKTESNGTKYDNYSTKGNTNPYTGKQGYANPAPSNLSKPYEIPQIKSYNDPLDSYDN